MTNITALIDELGSIKAAAAEIAKREAAIKKILIAEIGEGSAEGGVFRVAISKSERETLDQDAVRAKLSPQFIAAHTTVTEVVTVRVSARIAKAA